MWPAAWIAAIALIVLPFTRSRSAFAAGAPSIARLSGSAGCLLDPESVGPPFGNGAPGVGPCARAGPTIGGQAYGVSVASDGRDVFVQSRRMGVLCVAHRSRAASRRPGVCRPCRRLFDVVP